MEYGGKVKRRVEGEFDSTISQILQSVGRDYRRLPGLADALGVSYQVLTYWIEKYLDIRKEDFYRKVVCKSPCVLIKVEGGYRYKVDNKIHCNCKCRIGADTIVARIERADVDRLCVKHGWDLTINEDDSYIIKI